MEHEEVLTRGKTLYDWSKIKPNLEWKTQEATLFIFSCKENTLKIHTHNHAPTILDLINQGFTTNHNFGIKGEGEKKKGST